MQYFLPIWLYGLGKHSQNIRFIPKSFDKSHKIILQDISCKDLII